MKRKAIQQLINWKNKEIKQPLVINGLKGVGKTYLSLDFAKSFYDGNLYINFENNDDIGFAFEENERQAIPEDFDNLICAFYQMPKELLGNILIILDELQCSPSAYVSFLQRPEQSIPLSTLLITSETTSFLELPCHNFERIHLYPLEFDEYLIANGSEWYADIILAHSQNNRKVPEIVHSDLLGLFEDYLEVGGMPAAVNEFFNIESAENVKEVHQSIFNNIHMANQRKYPEGESLKMQQVLEVMESQVLKENRKFQYRYIRKGATYSMFKDAILDLKSNGHILMCNKMLNLKEENIELDETVFQLYYFDVGVLNSLMKKNRVATKMAEEKMRKIILENYVMQSLVSKGYQTVFWESNSQAKIDFLFQNKDGLIPIEVRSSVNTRSKSVGVFRNMYDIPYSIKLSSKNFEIVNHIKYIPYYAMFTL